MSQRERNTIIAAASWYPDQVKLIEGLGATVKVLPDRIDDQFLKEIETAEALIVGILHIPRQVLERAPRLHIVAVQGVGYNTVDWQAAEELGIIVTNTPRVNSAAVAEFTFGLILAQVRRIPQAWNELVKGGWDRLRFSGMELGGKTLSILGFGEIGRRVAKLGTAFGMEVLVWSRTLDGRVLQEAGARPAAKDQAIAQADILTLHLPLTAATKNIIGPQELAMMKPYSFLINTARAGLVNNDALIEALNNKKIAGAAIDIFEPEPPVDRSLIEHPKILTTPHIGGFTEEARYRMCMASAEQVVFALQGKIPPYAVNAPENPRYLRLNQY